MNGPVCRRMRAVLILSFIFSPCGCILLDPGLVHGGGTYQFELTGCENPPTSQPIPRYVVLTERIRYERRAITYVRAEMQACSNRCFTAKLPPMLDLNIALWLSKAGNLYLVGEKHEYVYVSFFAPGYRAQIILPEQGEGAPTSAAMMPKVPRNRHNGPRPDPGTIESAGDELCALPYTKLSSSKLLVQLPMRPLSTKSLTTKFDPYCKFEFEEMLERLRAEIRLGLLDRVDMEARKIVYRAIMQQACDPVFAGALDAHDEITGGIKPIANWAGIEPQQTED